MAALGAIYSWASAQAIDVVVTYGRVEVASVTTMPEWGRVIMSVGLAVFAAHDVQRFGPQDHFGHRTGRFWHLWHQVNKWQAVHR